MVSAKISAFEKYNQVCYLLKFIYFVNVDNPPYCLRHRYRSVVSEEVDTGTFLLSIRASDVDEGSHDNLRYYLTGAGSEHFSLDKTGGMLILMCWILFCSKLEFRPLK